MMRQLSSADIGSCQVRAQLRDVQKIYATGSAFAAILANGSVVAWGDPESPGQV